MIKEISLAKIASVRIGHAFRTAITPEKNGQISVVQAKDIDVSKPIDDKTLLTKIATNLPRSNSFLEKNDVLLTSRGSGSHRATIYTADDENTIASASLYIIRVHDGQVLPEYVAVFLNSPEGQSRLTQITSGAYIQNITMNNLKDLMIPIFSVSQQQNLVNLQKNIFMQEKIQKRKIELKHNIINSTIKNFIRKQSK